MTIAALQQLIKDLTFEEPDFCNDDAFLRWIELKGLELSPREFGDAVSAGYIACKTEGNHGARVAAYQKELKRHHPELG